MASLGFREGTRVLKQDGCDTPLSQLEWGWEATDENLNKDLQLKIRVAELLLLSSPPQDW